MQQRRYAYENGERARRERTPPDSSTASRLLACGTSIERQHKRDLCSARTLRREMSGLLRWAARTSPARRDCGTSRRTATARAHSHRALHPPAAAVVEEVVEEEARKRRATTPPCRRQPRRSQGACSCSCPTREVGTAHPRRRCATRSTSCTGTAFRLKSSTSGRTTRLGPSTARLEATALWCGTAGCGD